MPNKEVNCKHCEMQKKLMRKIMPGKKLTRKEQIKKAAWLFYPDDMDANHQIFMDGAEWADENPSDFTMESYMFEKIKESADKKEIIEYKLNLAIKVLKDIATNTLVFPASKSAKIILKKINDEK